MFMVSIIDIVGYIPSLRKTYQEPWTETPLTWIIFVLTNILSIAALDAYNVLTLFYLISITIADTTLLTICLLRRKKIPIPV